MKFSKLKLAVVGVGHLGTQHARIYSELARDPANGIEFVGVFDVAESKAVAAQSNHGGKVFPSLESVVEAADAVSIATPTDHHFSVAQTFLSRGIHVLIEKPIAQNVEQAESLCAVAKKHGCILQVGHVERFNPVIRFLEQSVQHPVFIEAHRLAPYQPRGTEVGVVLDLMIHDLEIILHLVKSPLKEVTAVGVPILSRTEDIANARLIFANGAVANVTASRASIERMRKIRVFAPDLYVSLDYQKQNGTLFRKTKRSQTAAPDRVGPTKAALFKQAARKFFGKSPDRMVVAQLGEMEIAREALPLQKQEPLRLELQSFIECVRENKQPLVSGEQATEALRLATRITEIIQQNLPKIGE